MLSFTNSFNGSFYTSSKNPNMPIITILQALKIKEGFVKIYYKGVFDYVNISYNDTSYNNITDNSFNITNLICDTIYNISVTPIKNNKYGNRKNIQIRTLALLMNSNSSNINTLSVFKTLSSYTPSWAGVGGIPGVRNLYSSGGAGYSLRKINKDYNGYCIKIYRTSDGTYRDIGFKNYIVDIDAILNFCSNQHGFVQTWYDQFNSFDLIQHNPANYPQIVYNGSIIYLNGFPHIIFSGIAYHPYSDLSGTSFLFNKDMGFNPFKKFNLSVIGTRLYPTTDNGIFVFIDPYINNNFANNGAYYSSKFSVNGSNISDATYNRGSDHFDVTPPYFNTNKTFIYNIYLNDKNNNNYGSQNLTCYSSFLSKDTSNNQTRQLNIYNKFGVLAHIDRTDASRYASGPTSYLFNWQNQTYETYTYDFSKISRRDYMVNYNNLQDISCGAFNLGCNYHAFGATTKDYRNEDFFGGIQEVIVGVSTKTTNDLSNVYINQQNYFFDNFYYFT
jgi:hypothetical protein